MKISLWQAHVQWKKNGQAGMSRQYMYVKCILACWAEYKCVQNAPWLVRQNRHECKMDPELLGEYTFMQNAPWLVKQLLNVCKMHPGLLGRIYICAKRTLSCWVE